jgi:homoserine kinase
MEPTMGGLLACTEDLVHQPYRAPLMPHSAEAMQRLRHAGIPAAISGAGPSVVCLVVRGEEEGVRTQAAQMEGWELLELDWDLEGARIVQS